MSSAAVLTVGGDIEGGAALRLQRVGGGAGEGAGHIAAQDTSDGEFAGGVGLDSTNHRAESQSHDQNCWLQQRKPCPY